MRERFATYWAGLTERERRLVGILGIVAGLVVVFLIVYLPSQAIAELEEENEEIVLVLREIGAAHTRLDARARERAIAEARYDVRAPALASFLGTMASRESVTLPEVTNQPEVEEGRFRRRHVRAELGNAPLRSTIRFLSSLESEPYPIAIERIHIEHFAAGEDRFNVEVGVLTFDRNGTSATASTDTPDAGVEPAAERTGRAGPAVPPP
jgi:hypothetical protein